MFPRFWDGAALWPAALELWQDPVSGCGLLFEWLAIRLSNYLTT